MSCPYFYPARRLDEDTWAVPPRLPLGDAYLGECRADAAPREPEDSAARNLCNSGYARGKCAWFPEDARADAVRFHVRAESGDGIDVQYIFEKACFPLEHGELHYSIALGSFSAQPLDAVAGRQAAVFVESYLRKVR